MPQRKALLWLALTAACPCCVQPAIQPAIQPASAHHPEAKADAPPIVIRDFKQGLAGVKTVKNDVKLSLGSDPEHAGELTLTVEYPKPSADDAARDVWCDTQHRDWRAGSVILFRVKPDHAVKLSVSFMDHNGVAYTAWIVAAEPGVWQVSDARSPFFRIA
ncbi:MAG TPA: hypothetical protein VGL19_00440 [Polyangiaceae bacterium]